MEMNLHFDGLDQNILNLTAPHPKNLWIRAPHVRNLLYLPVTHPQSLAFHWPPSVWAMHPPQPLVCIRPLTSRESLSVT